jgi:hypothetical protein
LILQTVLKKVPSTSNKEPDPMDRDHLDQIADNIRNTFEEVSDARDHAYEQSRRLISICAKSIRATHREDWEQAERLMEEAQTAAESLVEGVENYPSLYHAGYTQVFAKTIKFLTNEKDKRDETSMDYGHDLFNDASVRPQSDGSEHYHKWSGARHNG